MSQLTTTSYAILGLLSLRPHSAYELTQQARRTLRFVWPTSESQLYAEPKRLEREGLITRSVQPAGQRRSRAIYAITPDGRDALRTWLESAPPPPAPASEILLRVVFADAADKAALLGSLRDYREAVTAQQEVGRALVAEHLDGRPPYPERARLNVVWWVFVAEQFRLTLAWIDFAEREITRWGDTEPRALDRRSTRLALRIVNGDQIL